MTNYYSRHDKHTDRVTPVGIASLTSHAPAVQGNKNGEDWFADIQLSARTGLLGQEQVMLEMARPLIMVNLMLWSSTENGVWESIEKGTEADIETSGSSSSSFGNGVILLHLQILLEELLLYTFKTRPETLNDVDSAEEVRSPRGISLIPVARVNYGLEKITSKKSTRD